MSIWGTAPPDVSLSLFCEPCETAENTARVDKTFSKTRSSWAGVLLQTARGVAHLLPLRIDHSIPDSFSYGPALLSSGWTCVQELLTGHRAATASHWSTSATPHGRKEEEKVLDNLKEDMKQLRN
ncbi:hypothetical protein EYF80_014931 [Liparis tanakae]|uniref:Uncharacterized protein n=1 Tax=Liparis tanakae TaxID=230148 RepID=A0A4Z2IAP7_9TELE|nr:hypothetical protein EYF80_014931 [Liparis tanakae]